MIHQNPTPTHNLNSTSWAGVTRQLHTPRTGMLSIGRILTERVWAVPATLAACTVHALGARVLAQQTLYWSLVSLGAAVASGAACAGGLRSIGVVTSLTLRTALIPSITVYHRGNREISYACQSYLLSWSTSGHSQPAGHSVQMVWLPIE